MSPPLVNRKTIDDEYLGYLIDSGLYTIRELEKEVGANKNQLRRSFERYKAKEKRMNNLCQSLPIVKDAFIHESYTSSLQIIKNCLQEVREESIRKSQVSTSAGNEDMKNKQKKLEKITQYDSVVAGKISTAKRATVKMGSRGADVIYLQQQLAALGYAVRKIDGIFGAKTLAAVKAFQTENNLVIDGIVGKNTWAALELFV